MRIIVGLLTAVLGVALVGCGEDAQEVAMEKAALWHLHAATGVLQSGGGAIACLALGRTR